MAEIVLLGTAQDGGLPHAGCQCANCRSAREDLNFRRMPASLGLRSGDEWAMIDATSSFADQMHLLWTRRDSSDPDFSGRYGPPDALVLSHAHSGHFMGLWQLDRSVLGAPQTPVFVDSTMASFLRSQATWAVMENEGFVQFSCYEAGRPFQILPGIEIVPIVVPHRSEWPVATHAFYIQGPQRRVLYLSDIDDWSAWSESLPDVVAGVDVAILDGCFWDAPPFPGVPHPPILETMDLLQGLAESESTQIVFTHLNHTNPVVDPNSEEAQEVRRRGFIVGDDGMSSEI